MLLFCLEQEREKKLYQAWVSAYPHMSQEDFVPFEKFIKQEETYTPHVDVEEREREMEAIIANYERGLSGENI